MSKSSPSPLIERTVELLLRELAKVGDSETSLPSRRELGRKLGVSYPSINRAMEILRERGIVESREGSYTYLKKSPNEQRTRLSLWVHDRKSVNTIEFVATRHRFQKQYCETHPNLEIQEDQVEGTGGSNEGFLIQSVLQGPIPTAHPIRQTCLSFYYENGMLAPFQPEQVEGDEYVERLAPRLKNVCSRNGQLYLLPTSVNGSFLLYDKVLFRRAGLNPDRPPRDWEEFREYARELSISENGRPSFHVDGSFHAVWWLMQLVYGVLPATDSDVLPAIDWGSSAARRALEWFVRLYFHEKLIQIHTNSAVSMVSRCLAGEIAMFCGGQSTAVELLRLGEAERFGIAPTPMGPNGKKLGLLDGMGWFINANATPEQRRAVMSYLLTFERWRHLGSGAASPQRLSAWPTLFSPLIRHGEDQLCIQQMPRGWRETLEEVECMGQWEAPKSDWEKAQLKEILQRLLADDSKVAPEVIQNEFRTAR